MKKSIGLMALLLAGGMAFAQGTVSLKVSYKFVNIVEGYDHACKTTVYVDGNSVMESPESIESKGGKFTAAIPTGTHDLRLVNFAQYEGNWEEHTVDNEYSIDCTYEAAGHNFQKTEKLYLVHDIDAKTYYSWGKAIKIKKKKVDGKKVYTVVPPDGQE